MVRTAWEKLEAGLFVLCGEVIPSADSSRKNDCDCDGGDDESRAMGDCPIGRFSGGVDGDTAEGICFS